MHTSMAPRTRAKNSDANFKVYYSKKVPKQAYFPHKRKTVRRRASPKRNGASGRQAMFLKDKMVELGRQAKEDDSKGAEFSEESVEEFVPEIKKEKSPSPVAKTADKKRKRAAIAEDLEEDEELHIPKSRRVSNSRKRVSRKSESALEDSDNSEDDKTKKWRAKRQSTMTQMVDGRRPLEGIEEPNFKPIKRGPRTSWGGKSNKEKDRKQRTLTQMVPGMRPYIPSSEDEEEEDDEQNNSEEERESQAYNDALAQRLAQQGITQTEDHDEDEITQGTEAEGEESALPSVEVKDEHTGQPLQMSPCSSRAETPRKTAFMSLSTPTRRHIREIASSQSPAESHFSTQISPLKTWQSTPKKSTQRNVTAPETPSKATGTTPKPPTTGTHAPPTLSRFPNTIPDSEDEGSDFEDEVSVPTKESPETTTDEQCEREPQTLQQQTEDHDLRDSTPMVLDDVSSDEEIVSAPSPRGESHVALDDEQVGIHYAAEGADQVEESQLPVYRNETQQSHSSGAEQQLQSEWLSYSQFHHSNSHESSSMKATLDPSSRYATLATTQIASRSSQCPYSIQLSQATTVDEVTPKKNRTQRSVHTNVTPQKLASSQPFISPRRPPPLVIPSSFPSPSKGTMEAWSSPVLGGSPNTFNPDQYDSLEDFSIPLPPPIEHD